MVLDVPGVATPLVPPMAQSGMDTIAAVRDAADQLFETGQLALCIGASGILVETLLKRGTDADVCEAEAAIERLAETVVDDVCAVLTALGEAA